MTKAFIAFQTFDSVDDREDLEQNLLVTEQERTSSSNPAPAPGIASGSTQPKRSPSDFPNS